MTPGQLAMIGGLQPQVMGQPSSHPYLAMAGMPSVSSYGGSPSASPAGNVNIDQRLPHGMMNQHVAQMQSGSGNVQSHSPNTSTALQRSSSSACAVSGGPGFFQVGSPSPTGPGTPNSGGSNPAHTPTTSPSAQSPQQSGSSCSQQQHMTAGSLQELQRMTNGLNTDVPVCAGNMPVTQNPGYMTSRNSTPPSQHKQSSYSHSGHSRSRQNNQRPPNVTLNHSNLMAGYPGLNMNGYPHMAQHSSYLAGNPGFLNQSQIPMNMPPMMHSQANFQDGSGRPGSAQNPMYSYPYINPLMGPLNSSMRR